MATSLSDIKRRYPLPVYNYRVTVLPASLSSLPAGTDPANVIGVGIVISCSSVSGLATEVEPVTYKHGFSFIMGDNIIPGQRQEVRLSIQKGVTRSGRYLSDWMALCYPVVAPKPASLMRKRDLVIDLCDEAGLPVVRWIAARAMPIKLEAPAFEANSDEVAIERLDLIAHQLQVYHDL